MYLITNRKLSTRKQGLDVFGKTPNIKGPKELRLVKVERVNDQWVTTPVDDLLPRKDVKRLKNQHHLDIDVNERWYGSLGVACEIYTRAKAENRSILFFVHGYNNDVEDVINAALEIEKLYNVIVVPFTWPANGGGAVSGTAAYLSDKSDARVSSSALDRAIEKVHGFHQIFSSASQASNRVKAYQKHKDNPEAAAALFTRLTESECQVKISLLCHSMGNYVFKHVFSTTDRFSSNLVFDNICLVAADTNNHDHARWVEQLDVRKRVYVVINEDDSALKVSRIKPGREQKARLGHYLKNLSADNASYVDLTSSEGLGAEHTYFKGDTVKANADIQKFFNEIFNGRAADDCLLYRPDIRAYRLS